MPGRRRAGRRCPSGEDSTMRLLGRRTHKPGLAPGTLEFTGERKVEQTRLRFIDYDQEQIAERELAGIDECFPLRDTPTVSWINVDGLHETEMLRHCANHFGLHPLVVEDIVNTGQRPKLEDYHDYLYIVLKMLRYDETAGEISSEQMSLVVGPNYVLSFQERVGDVFEPVRERLRHGKGRARKLGTDYLAYMLIDAVVDHYFLVLERVGEQIESLEEDLLEHPRQSLLQKVHTLKREMILLRRSVWPLREVLGALERAESRLIQKDTGIFLRDVYDHTIQVADAIESFRDILSGLQDLYLSSVSNRMNEVMKVLTVIATIFIPLGFLAGVYGMNFEWIPELGWKWSYPIFWLVILVIVVGMITIFRRKRWL
jgi:magnesium transporter